MNNASLMNIIFLSCAIFFALLTLITFLAKTKQKKLLYKSLETNQTALDSLLATDESKLKQALGSELTEKLTSQVDAIITIEKESYKNLAQLFIDYQPVAIEMMPVTIGKIITAYTDCIRKIVELLSDVSVVLPKEKPEPDPDELNESFQYEALIEQLRIEKQTYADKYNTAFDLLNLIYLKYRDKLDTNTVESLEAMSLSEIATIFKVEQPLEL